MTSSESVRVLLVRKLLGTLAALFVLIFLTFVLLKAIPGGPFDEDSSYNPAIKEKMEKIWALDQSGVDQFLFYTKSLLSGNFGYSMIHSGKSVGELISASFAQTVNLNLLAIICTFLGAGVSSLLASLNKDAQQFLNGLSVVLNALPSLFLGPVLIYVFGFYWNLLPTAFLSSPSHYILPVLTMCLRSWAQLHMLLQNSLQESLQQDYIRTAKAKGLSNIRILVAHAYRNSLTPVLSISGPLVVGLISGSFLVEILFSISGMGRLFVDSINLRDYPAVMALVFIYGAAMIVMTQFFDLLSGYLDPRIREERL